MIKKLMTLIISALIIMNPISVKAQEQSESGLVDETLQDLTIVMGSGAVGALLGLSTLSFVDKPKDHMKNIAVGGAIGIVVGVGIVIFSQATKSQTTIVSQHSLKPHSDVAAESLSRLEFSEQRIAAKYTLPATAQFNLSF